MRKFYLLFIGLMIVNIIDAQIGINTENPQGVFHIDPVGDTNGATGTSDDFIVTKTGNVGIGTINPNYKLEIISNPAPAIRIADGTEGEGKTLTSDANGVATWQTGTQMTRIAGDDPIGISFSTFTEVKYRNKKIVLTTGTWIVRYSITWSIMYKPSPPKTGVSYIDVFLSRSPSSYIKDIVEGSWTIIPFTYGTYAASSQITVIYNVTQPSETLYLWCFWNGIEQIQNVSSYNTLDVTNSNIFEAIKW